MTITQQLYSQLLTAHALPQAAPPITAGSSTPCLLSSPIILQAAPPTPTTADLSTHTSPTHLEYAAEISKCLQVVDVNDDWPQSVVQWVAQALQKTAGVNRDGQK